MDSFRLALATTKSKIFAATQHHSPRSRQHIRQRTMPAEWCLYEHVRALECGKRKMSILGTACVSPWRQRLLLQICSRKELGLDQALSDLAPNVLAAKRHARDHRGFIDDTRMREHIHTRGVLPCRQNSLFWILSKKVRLGDWTVDLALLGSLEPAFFLFVCYCSDCIHARAQRRVNTMKRDSEKQKIT